MFIIIIIYLVGTLANEKLYYYLNVFSLPNQIRLLDIISSYNYPLFFNDYCIHS